MKDGVVLLTLPDLILLPLPLLAFRIACTKEGAALLTLPDAAAGTALAQGLSGTEVSAGFGACYVAGGALPPAPHKRGYYQGGNPAPPKRNQGQGHWQQQQQY